MILPQFYTDDIIKRAILEDINYVDVEIGRASCRERV